jgi:uncharacterized protein
MIKKIIIFITGVFVVFLLIVLMMNIFPYQESLHHSAIIIGTGSTGGTYFPLGSGMAKIFNLYLEDVVSSAIVSQGSVDNINMIADGEVQLALAQNDVVYYAYNGLRMFEGKKKESLRAIATLYPEVIHIVLRGDTSLESVSDLVGQKVVLGAERSGTAINAEQILKAYGIYEKIEPVYLTFDEAIEQIKSGNVTAAFLTIGTPAKVISDLADDVGVKIMAIDQEIIEELEENYPFYTAVIIPGDTYQGENEDKKTLAVKAMLIVNENLEVDLVYNLSQVIYQHLDILAAAHEKGGVIFWETALEGIPIPLHLGAEKYFGE